MRNQLALILAAVAALSCRDASTATGPDEAATLAGLSVRSGAAAKDCRPGKKSRAGITRDLPSAQRRPACAPLDPALEQALASARKTDAFIVIVNFDATATTH